MKKFIPTMYQKSVFDIPYKKLKEKGIKCIMFDLDNTLALIDDKTTSKKAKDLCQKLEKDFKVIIVSNTTKKRLVSHLNEIGVEGFHMSIKPFSKSFKKVMRKYNYKKEEMVLIGDQLMTDILGGNCFGIMTVLVTPLGKKDLKLTKFNRILEDIIIKKLSKKGILERGKYYE